MALEISLYGLVFSIFFNLKILKNEYRFLNITIYIFTIFLPIIFLSLNQILFLIPIIFVLLIRLLNKNTNILLDFFVYFNMLVSTYNPSFIPILVSVIFLSIAQLISSLDKSKENLKWQINNMYNNVFLIFTTSLFLISKIIDNQRASQVLIVLSALIFSIYIFRTIGPLAPYRIKKPKGIKKLNNTLLLEVISYYFVPVMIINFVKQYFDLSSELFNQLNSILYFFTISTLVLKKFYLKRNTFSDMSKDAYTLNFIIISFCLLSSQELKVSSFYVYYAFVYLLYLTIYLSEMRNSKYSFYIKNVVIFLQYPLFLSPLFYLYINQNNKFLVNANIYGSFVILLGLFVPYLLIDKNVFLPKKTTKHESSLLILTSLFIVCLYFIMVFYGKI